MRTFVRASIAVLGLQIAVAGGWALVTPSGFSDFVNFAPNRHFAHDVGAFQLGIGAALLLAVIWVDAAMVILAGYLVSGVAHTWTHLADADIGGSAIQTLVIGLLTVLAAVAFVLRWRELGWVVGAVEQARCRRLRRSSTSRR